MSLLTCINRGDGVIHLGIVSCGAGGRHEEAQVLIKSAILNSQRELHIHIFSDEKMHSSFAKQVLS